LYGQFRIPHEILRDYLEEIHFRPLRKDVGIMGDAKSQAYGKFGDQPSWQFPVEQEDFPLQSCRETTLLASML
jgi:hypothetical protein